MLATLPPILQTILQIIVQIGILLVFFGFILGSLKFGISWFFLKKYKTKKKELFLGNLLVSAISFPTLLALHSLATYHLQRLAPNDTMTWWIHQNVRNTEPWIFLIPVLAEYLLLRWRLRELTKGESVVPSQMPSRIALAVTLMINVPVFLFILFLSALS